MARSRAVRAASPSGDAMSLATSSCDKKWGKGRLRRGARSPSAGFVVSTPWRHRNRNHDRTAATRRATVLLAYPCSDSQATRARSVRGVTISTVGASVRRLVLKKPMACVEVFAVGLDRVRGRVPLEGEVAQEVGRMLVHDDRG